jgi:hypothetical protein
MEALVVSSAYFVTIIRQVGHIQFPVHVAVKAVKEALECDVGSVGDRLEPLACARGRWSGRDVVTSLPTAFIVEQF